MKIFIAFMLLFVTNCLAPVAVSATFNVKTAAVSSVILPVKKLNFKERFYLKLSGKAKQENTRNKDSFALAIILIVLGLILMVIGDSAAKAAASRPSNGFIPSFDGLGESLLGGTISSIGIMIFWVKLFRRLNRKPKPTS
jgi:hypothetical protein